MQNVRFQQKCDQKTKWKMKGVYGFFENACWFPLSSAFGGDSLKMTGRIQQAVFLVFQNENLLSYLNNNNSFPERYFFFKGGLQSRNVKL